MSTEITAPEFYLNSRGFQVPADQMAPQDTLKHEMVMQHIETAMRLSKEVDTLKRTVFSDIQDFVGLLADLYDTEINTGKGNIALTSFDGKYQIKIGIDDLISFGPEIDIAKKLIGEVAEEELGQSSDFLRQIVLDAFQADKQGNYNKNRIMALRKYRKASSHPKWANAMKALDDGIIAGSTKTYITFHEKNVYGKWVQIPLASKSL
jgi:hypothetical protein